MIPEEVATLFYPFNMPHMAAFHSDPQSANIGCAFPYKEEYVGEHKRRQREVAMQLFEVMGIEREDKEKRMDWMLRGFRQFDAPVSLVLTYPKSLEPAAITQFSLGSLAYGIVLAAWERGIGCVINGQGIMQSDVVHKHAGIPDDEAIMICIAMGYPDDSFPANGVRSVRADNREFVTYVGFPSRSSS